MRESPLRLEAQATQERSQPSREEIVSPVASGEPVAVPSEARPSVAPPFLPALEPARHHCGPLLVPCVSAHPDPRGARTAPDATHPAPRIPEDTALDSAGAGRG